MRYTYDKVSNPITVEHLLTGEGSGVVNYTYDKQDRLKTAKGCQQTKNNQSNGYTQNFAYDEIHNITAKGRSNSIYTGTTCDVGGQVIEAANKGRNDLALNYDYLSSAPHRATSVGGVALSYDPSGNVVQKGSDLYAWDDANRMKQAQVPSARGNGTQTVANYYDAGGNRVLKKNNKGYTFYVNPFFDIQSPLQANASSNRIAAKHIFAAGNRVASEQINFDVRTEGDLTATPTASGKNGSALFFHPDPIGSATLLTNQSGQVYEINEFFPDGETWLRSGFTQPVQGYFFSGKPIDTETNLYDFGARFYDPKTSLWMSIDPVFNGSAKSASKYNYANLNPLKFRDPDGRCPMCAGIAIEIMKDAAIPIAISVGGYLAEKLYYGESPTVTGVLVSGTIGVGGGLAGSLFKVTGRVGLTLLYGSTGAVSAWAVPCADGLGCSLHPVRLLKGAIGAIILGHTFRVIGKFAVKGWERFAVWRAGRTPSAAGTGSGGGSGNTTVGAQGSGSGGSPTETNGGSNTVTGGGTHTGNSGGTGPGQTSAPGTGMTAAPPAGPTGPSGNTAFAVSTIEDVTTPGSVPNEKINLTRAEFEANLRSEGFSASPKGGPKNVTVYTKGGVKYTVRDNATSTGGPSVDYHKPDPVNPSTPSKDITKKFRLDPNP